MLRTISTGTCGSREISIFRMSHNLAKRSYVNNSDISLLWTPGNMTDAHRSTSYFDGYLLSGQLTDEFS
jgi:hypothetical protein